MLNFKENDTVVIKLTGEKAHYIKQITTCPVKGAPPIKTNVAQVQLIDTDEIVTVLLQDLGVYELYI